MLLQHIVQQTHDSLTALLGIAASFEDAGTAGFQTECCHVDGDIGASLVDDTYHTERHTHALQIESVGERARLEDASQRGRKFCHLACVGCNTFQTLLIEQETVVHRVCLVHAREVDSIGLQHFWNVLLQSICHRQKHLVYLFLRALIQSSCRCLYLVAVYHFTNLVSWVQNGCEAHPCVRTPGR